VDEAIKERIGLYQYQGRLSWRYIQQQSVCQWERNRIPIIVLKPATTTEYLALRRRTLAVDSFHVAVETT